jgi:hypothetical protein
VDGRGIAASEAVTLGSPARQTSTKSPAKARIAANRTAASTNFRSLTSVSLCPKNDQPRRSTVTTNRPIRRDIGFRALAAMRPQHPQKATTSHYHLPP